MDSNPKFAFHEKVRIRTGNPKLAEINGLSAAVLGRVQSDDGSWSYSVHIDERPALYQVAEADLMPTGEHAKRSDFYDGECIQVSRDGKLNGYCFEQTISMDTLLVTVTEVFELAGNRVIIADEFYHDFNGRSVPFELDVVVVSPCGERMQMTASISQPLNHARPPRESGFVCIFHGASKSLFPIGTRIVIPNV